MNRRLDRILDIRKRAVDAAQANLTLCTGVVSLKRDELGRAQRVVAEWLAVPLPAMVTADAIERRDLHICKAQADVTRAAAALEAAVMDEERARRALAEARREQRKIEIHRDTLAEREREDAQRRARLAEDEHAARAREETP